MATIAIVSIKQTKSFVFLKLVRPFGNEIFRCEDFWRPGIQFHLQMS